MDLLLAARDGVKLAASLFESATPNGHAVLLNSGTGIPRQFYGAFARHLVDRGFTVLTYDYRGLGGSDKPRDATMEQWGSIDQASMIDHLAALAPDASRAVIGHSLGSVILRRALGKLTANPPRHCFFLAPPMRACAMSGWLPMPGSTGRR